MRLRHRKFHATVNLQRGDPPIIIGLGVVSLEASIEEARQLAAALVDAIEAAQRAAVDK